MSETAARISGGSDLDKLVSRSRLLAADQRRVLHGGGNTSSKVVQLDHRGRQRTVLWIKGTGSDLAAITARQFAGLYLDDLLVLRDREEMQDDALVDYLRRSAVNPDGPRPSIETLLHAFVPAAHVDHTHSDAICALTNNPDAAAVVRDALGADVALVPYVRPGFALARLALPYLDASALVLEHHGVVTWGDTHEEALEAALAIEGKAEDYLSARLPPSEAEEPEVTLDPLFLPTLRGRLSGRRRRILHLDVSQRDLADRDDAAIVAAAARSTPDHMMRIGRETLIVSPGGEDRAVSAYEERRARAYASSRAQIPVGVPPLDPTPAVALTRGLGCIGIGRTPFEARRNTEIAFHSHRSVAATLDAFGEVEWLDEQDATEFEYWPLELAKLTSAPPLPELAGHVVLVTGAGSGIGREVVADLARRGAGLVLCDIDEPGLTETMAELDRDTAVGVRADMTSEADVARLIETAVHRFGGVDGVVSNAGIAVSGRLEELDLPTWQRSLAVNATSHFLLTRAVWPVLIAQGLGGSLVYIASKNAFSPGAGFGAYSAAKAAEIQIARIAALEGGAAGIRANAINPDAIFAGSHLWSQEMRAERAREHGVEPDQLEEFYVRRNLLQRHVTGSDVAEAVAFLLSDRSRATTGCVLTVDGGVPGAFPR